MRLLIAFLIGLISAPAWATPCPPPQITQGWGQSFYGTAVVSGFVYDQLSSNLYVILINRQYDTFFNVSYGVAQAFTTTKTPDYFFTSQIQNSYHESLETEVCGPLLTEAGGYLLTH